MIGVLSTLGIIILILILLAAAYFWWRHKRSQLEFVEPCDDHETSSASLKFQQLLETQQQEQLLEEQKKQQQQQPQQTGNNANKINTKLNGFLNLKTPLIGWVFACHEFSLFLAWTFLHLEKILTKKSEIFFVPMLCAYLKFYLWKCATALLFDTFGVKVLDFSHPKRNLSYFFEFFMIFPNPQYPSLVRLSNKRWSKFIIRPFIIIYLLDKIK